MCMAVYIVMSIDPLSVSQLRVILLLRKVNEQQKAKMRNCTCIGELLLLPFYLISIYQCLIGDVPRVVGQVFLLNVNLHLSCSINLAIDCCHNSQTLNSREFISDSAKGLRSDVQVCHNITSLRSRLLFDGFFFFPFPYWISIHLSYLPTCVGF